jgi:hypothetical protein
LRYIEDNLRLTTLPLFNIRVIPPLVEMFGWERAFAVPAVGPVFGIWSMLRLRQTRRPCGWRRGIARLDTSREGANEGT